MPTTVYHLEQQMLQSVKDAVNLALQTFPEDGVLSDPDHLALWAGIFNMSHTLNRQLFQSDLLEEDPFENCYRKGSQSFQKSLFQSSFSSWNDLIKSTLTHRLSLKTDLDIRFTMLLDRATHVPYETLVNQTIDNFHTLPVELQANLSLYYQGFPYMWGTLDPTNGCYEVIENRIRAFKEHAIDFSWLYHHLEDYRSKAVLTSFLEYWINYDPYALLNTKEPTFPDYFDLDLYQPAEDEVFVDLGSFTGDTVQDYLRTFPSYKSIYCFEMAPNNMKKLRENLQKYDNIYYVAKAVGSEKGSLTVYLRDGVDSANSVAQEEGVETVVEVTTVDEEITEPVSTLKMDIEGAEQDALRGCVRHIKEDHPKLLISVYHNNEDIWKIPRMIHELQPDYRFYLRNNGNQWGPSELVLLAL